MNQESTLAKAMMLELLSGAIQMKYIKMTTWRKVNYDIIVLHDMGLHVI